MTMTYLSVSEVGLDARVVSRAKPNSSLQEEARDKAAHWDKTISDEAANFMTYVQE
jgi:hypothetical protein